MPQKKAAAKAIKKFKNKSRWLIGLYLIIAVIIFLAMIILSILTVDRDLFSVPGRNFRLPTLTLVARQRPLTAKDTSAIRYWMTFDYLNKVFDLPATYLQTTLNISDHRYPRLSISSYARTEHQDINTVLSQVQTAIYKYLTPPK